MRNNKLKLLIAVIVMVIALSAVYIVGRNVEQSGYQETRTANSDGFGQYERLNYNGEDYIKRADVTTILLMGVDRTGSSAKTGYRSGGQSDFVMLVVLDHTNKTIRRLQIDRDTMTDVEVLGVLGTPIGHRQLQLCLSHAYGETQQDCCMNTVKSVESLLQGAVDIDLYAAIEIDSIPIINASLGGVTVTVPEDMTAVDPAMTEGAVLKLNGQQAEFMVRSRRVIGDGSNTARMRRQKVYMEAALQQFLAKVKASTSYIDTFFDDLGSTFTSNMTRGRIVNECNRAYGYTIGDIEYLKGELITGDDGFTEFHAEEQFIIDWVLSTLYKRP